MKRQLSTSLFVIGKSKNIPLEREDESLILQLMNEYKIEMNSERMVTFHPKIAINGQQISSKYRSRVQKRNNYTVAFSHLGKVKYGEIKYFITCPADSAHSIHIAVIDVQQVQCYEELLKLSYPPEIQCLSSILTSDFVCMTTKGPRVAVPIEHILIKCCEITVLDTIIVTTLVGRSEVAK